MRVHARAKEYLESNIAFMKISLKKSSNVTKVKSFVKNKILINNNDNPFWIYLFKTPFQDSGISEKPMS